MAHVLNNPVFNALCSGDASLSQGNSEVKYFKEAVSPFAGFPEEYAQGFDELHRLLPPDRSILYASTKHIPVPKGWQQLIKAEGLQFVLDKHMPASESNIKIVPLDKQNVGEMIELTTLTKPGPFNNRTIEFGYYIGIFENNQLAAMAGQRLHAGDYTEISAVCTHPDYLGKGFASALLQHQIALIIKQGKIPFLHVRADNQRAIALYERLGFKMRGPMNFYFLRRR